MRSTSPGYNLYCNSGTKDLIRFVKEGGKYYFGGKVSGPRHFMWAIKLTSNDNPIMFANNLTSKKTFEWSIEFELGTEAEVSGTVSKVIAPNDLIYLEEIENLP